MSFGGSSCFGGKGRSKGSKNRQYGRVSSVSLTRFPWCSKGDLLQHDPNSQDQGLRVSRSFNFSAFKEISPVILEGVERGMCMPGRVGERGQRKAKGAAASDETSEIVEGRHLARTAGFRYFNFPVRLARSLYPWDDARPTPNGRLRCKCLAVLVARMKTLLVKLGKFPMAIVIFCTFLHPAKLRLGNIGYCHILHASFE